MGIIQQIFCARRQERTFHDRTQDGFRTVIKRTGLTFGECAAAAEIAPMTLAHWSAGRLSSEAQTALVTQRVFGWMRNFPDHVFVPFRVLSYGQVNEARERLERWLFAAPRRTCEPIALWTRLDFAVVEDWVWSDGQPTIGDMAIAHIVNAALEAMGHLPDGSL